MIIKVEPGPVREYRERTGCGLFEAKEAVLKQLLLQKLRFADNFLEVKDIIETLIEHKMRG